LPQSGAHSSSARAWSTDDPDRARVFAAGEHCAAVQHELNVAGWILGRSVRTVPIPGFRTVAQVEDNLGAHEHGPLSADELRQVEELLW
jgi:aryl-alcohol dehydrogenase-like predicted oxidoreductase